MADITKCTQALCPVAGDCWRRSAPDSDMQAWATWQYAVSPRGIECDGYWPTYIYTVSDRTTAGEGETT